MYDADGNISAPVERCVTVESWGGYAAVAAKWEYVESEIAEGDMTTATYEVGEAECYNDEISCTGTSGTVEVFDCYTINEGILEIKADGTFVFSSDENEEYTMDAESAENCSQVIENKDYVYNSTGNWAYVSAEKRLTLIEYSYSETEVGGETVSETVAPGEGYVLFHGIAELNGNTFVFYIEEDFGETDSQETSKITFKK
ncbi:MAG: hypothetical protein AAGF77_09045 [Bacteroidota bacterium]